MRRQTIFTAVVCLMSLAVLSLEAGEPKKKTFIDAKEAGPDFQVQGEYAGTNADGDKLGIQVVAHGDGAFEAVLLKGGLPGAGWDGKTRLKAQGKTEGETTKFAGNEFEGSIAGKAFSGSGEQVGEFKAEKVLRKSPTLGAKPPKGALVLFDGSNVDEWQTGTLEQDNLLGVSDPKGARTKKKFNDFTLHLEFRTPFMPFARGQGRGNSGMYLLDQYECQILDSFGLTGEDNECGGIYSNSRPAVNMCLPPLSWQTYDVEFQAARFDDDGNKTADAVTTIKHNGVVIHDKLKLKLTAGGGQSDERPGALYLQNHGNPVHFRNIWIVEK